MAEQIVRLCRTGAGRMGSRGPACPGLQSQTFAGAVPRERKLPFQQNKNLQILHRESLLSLLC